MTDKFFTLYWYLCTVLVFPSSLIILAMDYKKQYSGVRDLRLSSLAHTHTSPLIFSGGFKGGAWPPLILEFSEHLLLNFLLACLTPRIFEPLKNGITAHF